MSKLMSDLVAYMGGGVLDEQFGRETWQQANRLTVQRVNGELTVVGMKALVIVNIVNTDADVTAAKNQVYQIVDTRTMTMWTKGSSTWTSEPWSVARSPYMPGMLVRSAVNSKLNFINPDYSIEQIAAG